MIREAATEITTLRAELAAKDAALHEAQQGEECGKAVIEVIRAELAAAKERAVRAETTARLALQDHSAAEALLAAAKERAEKAETQHYWSAHSASALRNRVEAAEAKAEGLAKALEPFAKAAAELPDDRVMSDAHPEWERCMRRFKGKVDELIVRHFRHVATALAAYRTDKENDDAG